MAKRIQFCGKKYIEGDGVMGWEPDGSNTYVTEMFGVSYRLEKRNRNPKDETYDTGWYLFSQGAADGPDFFGEYCTKTLFESVDIATAMVLKADLRGEGHGPDATPTESATDAAHAAIKALRATDWTVNPAYWVGRLEEALTRVLAATES